MPRPRKYKSLHGSQAVYRTSEKGQKTEQKYEHSTRAKARKRLWWHERYGKNPINLREHFSEAYGNPLDALEHLYGTERQIISLYFGLESEPLGTEDIAAQLELTVGQVKMLKAKALQHL